ncbi:Uncharacterised protein [Streptococcus pneumoniae]|nr:Uncharacterised protein [Streptococcus pneumoniae]
MTSITAIFFDLDGTLVDKFYRDSQCLYLYL